MKYETNDVEGVTVVALEGDVDLESSPIARRLLLDLIARSCRLVVDLSRVGYMDSSGVASLVEALQSARKRGCGFIVAATGDSVLRVIRLARLDRVFTLSTTVQDGVAALRKG
jgi:anti-sigma B factor antagonist